MALPAPWLLWTLLFLAPVLSSQQGAWDSPNCTEGVVTVHRGQRALMSCNNSSPFTHVEIRLRAPGKAAQLIFSEDAPGDFSHAGWRLMVRGGEAQLVTQDAQPSQAGEYAWVLTGRQKNTRKTRLEVTEPPDAVPTVPVHQETVHSGGGRSAPWAQVRPLQVLTQRASPPPDTATPQPRNHAWTISGICIGVLLCVVGVGLFAWRRSRGPSALETLVQTVPGATPASAAKRCRPDTPPGSYRNPREQEQAWDAPNCTESVVTVPRGQRALMSCTSSNPFTHVNINLTAPGESTQLIFRVNASGNYSCAGWRLVVRGGEAQLVIQDAQPGQAGEYTWHLVGRQKNTKNTSLEVTDEGELLGHRTTLPFLRCTAGSPEEPRLSVHTASSGNLLAPDVLSFPRSHRPVRDQDPGGLPASPMVPPVPWLLWTLLLLAPALSSQQGAWDAPNCTEGVVTVPRGQRALMSCTSSSPFTHVDIHLRAPGKPTQLIFRVVAPGDFSHAWWRLMVRGGEAQLVIQDAQPGQAGEYTWHLVGRQRSTKNTRLEVSEPTDVVPTVPTPQETVHLVRPSQATLGCSAAAWGVLRAPGLQKRSRELRSRADLTWAHTALWGLGLLHPRRSHRPVRDQDPGGLPASPMAPPAPCLLWTLLFLAPALSSQQGAWDSPNCTEGVVTVHRGQRALMSCTSSSPFTHIDIRLRAPGKPTQLIFSEDAPGDFSHAGWRLVVRGGEAQLVTQDAQPGQAGEYTWVLTGRQKNTRKTRLEVTAPRDEVPTKRMDQDSLTIDSEPQDEHLSGTDPHNSLHLDTEMPQPQIHNMTVVGISLGVLLCLVGVGLYAWYSTRGPSKMEKLAQPVPPPVGGASCGVPSPLTLGAQDTPVCQASLLCQAGPTQTPLIPAFPEVGIRFCLMKPGPPTPRPSAMSRWAMLGLEAPGRGEAKPLPAQSGVFRASLSSYKEPGVLPRMAGLGVLDDQLGLASLHNEPPPSTGVIS
ncbi:Secreted and transmembrane protein 1 [Galemys pyrenaicus]|uniref:Secreted and transmembrane protein 1 n=1 Tax=Galemys pyrenaicus TaxID=202257 RepID=A0A8J5ZUL7_GALPY|nr:Secreted and transmembrane protein 1 [Galemys pyrenaicus]